MEAAVLALSLSKKEKAKAPTPDAEDDLKSMPLPEVGRSQSRQTSVNWAGGSEDVHFANDPK